jgi:hypothetical protein
MDVPEILKRFCNAWIFHLTKAKSLKLWQIIGHT